MSTAAVATTVALGLAACSGGSVGLDAGHDAERSRDRDDVSRAIGDTVSRYRSNVLDRVA